MIKEYEKMIEGILEPLGIRTVNLSGNLRKYVAVD